MWAKAVNKEEPKTGLPQKTEAAPAKQAKTHPNLMGKMYGKKD